MSKRPVIGVIPLIDYNKKSYWMLPGYFGGIIESVLNFSFFDKVIDTVASEDQLSLCGLFLTVIYNIAMNITDIGDSCHNACSVRIPQSSLYAVLIKTFSRNVVSLRES